MLEKKIDQKHIDKALKVQQRILNQVKGLSQEDILLFICAAYNAELAIAYQKIEEEGK